MKKRKQRKYTVKTYKTIKGRQLFFIKSKTYIKSCHFDRNLKFFKYKSSDPRFTSCSIKFKYSLEDLKQAEKRVTKEKTKKKKLWSWLFILLNLIIISVIIYQQFSTNQAVSFEELIALNPNLKYLAFALLLVLADVTVESLKTFHLLYISTHRIRPFLSYKSTQLCRYYDSISPMSTAGEPYQIYYLKSRGVRSEVATSIPIVKSLFWQMAHATIAIVLLTFNAQSYISLNPVVITVAWISIAINFFVLLVVLLLSTSKRVGPRIVIAVLKFLSKLHIIKNYQSTFRKVMRFVINYQTCMRSFATNFFTVACQIILAAGEIFISGLIPYFIYRTFIPDPTISALDIITRTIICNLSSLIIPIPGGSGAAEYSFLEMFSALFTNKTAVWAMLIWRTLTYYLIILRGIVITIYDGVYGNKKSERLVSSGYFNEKIHFAMIKRKQLKTRKIEQKLESQKTLETTNDAQTVYVEIKKDTKDTPTKNATKEQTKTHVTTKNKNKARSKKTQTKNTKKPK